MIGRQVIRSVQTLSAHCYDGHPPTAGILTHLGKGGSSKTDEFLEKFQTAFDPPPPHFRKIMLRFFSGIHDLRSVYNGKNLQHKFLDWK